MRNKLTKVALTASVLLALAFTLSCSDDDKEDTWLTCNELYSLSDSCYEKYKKELSDCIDDACSDRVHDKMDNCVIGSACNGTSEKECEAHYNKECSEEDEDEDEQPSP